MVRRFPDWVAVLVVGIASLQAAAKSMPSDETPSKATPAALGDEGTDANPYPPDGVATFSVGTESQGSDLLAGCAFTVLPGNGSTSRNERAPNSNYRFGRAVYLITAAELAAAGLASGTGLTGIGWHHSTAGIVASGGLVVYLENTSDTANTKSLTWTTAIAGMTVVHNAATTIPATTSPFDIPFSGGSPFTYTGGGLYVAFDWRWPGPAGTTAVVACTNTLVGGLKGENGTIAPPTTLIGSDFRPETRLTPSSGSVSDASVDVVMTLGALPIGVASPHVVRAAVSNRGTTALTNLPVTLNVSGAQSFSNTQNVVALPACGGQAIVSFAAFAPFALGRDTVTVSVPVDDNPSNNSASKPLDVTRNFYSYKYPGSTPSGWMGFTGGTGQIVAKYTTAFATQIDAVTVEFFSISATTYRLAVYTNDGTGKPGTQLYVDAADRTVSSAGSATIRLPAPVLVGPGDFFVGFQQTNTVNASYSSDGENPVRSGVFYIASLPAGTWTDLSPANNTKPNLGITLGSCIVPLSVDVTPSGPSSVCAGGSLTFSVAASGGTGTLTYQWTENGVDLPGETGTSLTLSKASAGSFIYNCRVSDDGGCLAIVDGSGAPGTWLADGAACEDGNPCTLGDLCAGGGCQAGTNPCDDGNACTQDLCNPVCSHASVSCDDLNPCTDDACVAPTGCTHAANTGPCSDGNVCTSGDTCAGAVCVPGTLPAFVEFCNPASIAINDGTLPPTPATPYPSSITVSNQRSRVCGVRVGLYALTHSFPDDIDILLAGPGAQNAILVSDVGGGFPGPSNVNLTLDDAAAASIPDDGPIVAGSVKPTNVNPGSGTEEWPGPAPVPGGGSALSVFNGTNTNGTWSLYVVDDESGDAGSIAGGWCLFVASTCVLDAECDDGDPCTLDVCAAPSCQHVAIGPPPEITGARFAPDEATLSWGAAALAARYDVLRGALSSLPVGPGSGDETCFPDIAGTSLTDGAAPASRGGFWYVVRGENTCAAPGSYGAASNGTPRVSTTCP